MLVDAAAAIIELYNFDAYGNPFGFDPKTALTSIGYSGESFDASINQQYLRARWYDAATGRFNRLDPFFGNHSDPQSFHKYLYTHGDPVNMTDPTGLFGVVGTISVTASYGNVQTTDASSKAGVGTSATHQLLRHAAHYNLRIGLQPTSQALSYQLFAKLLGQTVYILFGAVGVIRILGMVSQNQQQMTPSSTAGQTPNTGHSSTTSQTSTSNQQKCKNHVVYGNLDHKRRATGLVAVTGQIVPKYKAFTGYPSWWFTKLPRANGEIWQRGHMLSSSLGGDGGRQFRNMVPLHKHVNKGGIAGSSKGFRGFEISAENAVRAGHCVFTIIIADYVDHDEYYPGAIHINSYSDRGFKYNDVIINE